MIRIHFRSSIPTAQKRWMTVFALCPLCVRHATTRSNLKFVLSTGSLFFLSGIGPSKLVVSNQYPIIVLELLDAQAVPRQKEQIRFAHLR